MIHLVLGGARSGKSAFAERWIQEQELAHPEWPVYYLATGTAQDEEMTRRIARHRSERPTHWQTIEEPLQPGQQLRDLPPALVLVDCMTLWLSNWLCRDPSGWPAARQDFIDVLSNRSRHVVIVSNEVGSGIVPLGELNRQFVDESGWLNQALAQQADRVTLVVAGCSVILKDHPVR